MGSFLCDRNVCVWGTVISSIITDIAEGCNTIKSCKGAREEISDRNFSSPMDKDTFHVFASEQSHFTHDPQGISYQLDRLRMFALL
jgi:hypothetical protein